MDRTLGLAACAASCGSLLALGAILAGPAWQSPPSQDDEARLGALISRLVLEQIPHDYTQADSWGKTRRVADGLKLRREGLRVETYRTFRQVNHGTWNKYTVRLVDPQRSFHSRLANIRPGEAGRTAFELEFHVPLAITARQALWQLGVQVYSISVDATAEVHLRLSCDVAIEAGAGEFPPVLQLAPRVTAADLRLAEFRIHRVSKLGGEFAQQATRLAREPLEQKLAEYEPKLVEKCNAAIDRHRDAWQLHWTADLQEKWGEWSRPEQVPGNGSPPSESELSAPSRGVPPGQSGCR